MAPPIPLNRSRAQAGDVSIGHTAWAGDAVRPEVSNHRSAASGTVASGGGTHPEAGGSIAGRGGVRFAVSVERRGVR
jgi:hypothetical protein